MPHIAIDYTPAYEQGGGIGRYVRELTSALSRVDSTTEYRVFVSGTSNDELPTSIAPNFSWTSTRITPAWLARIWHRARLPIPVEFFIGQIDLFHATDFVLPPTLPTTRTVLTVHDLSFVRVPDSASPSLKAYLDSVVPRSVEKADHILADSQATKDDLIDLYQTPQEKITVLLSGVDTRFKPITDSNRLTQVRNKYGLHDVNYLLSVGTVQPRKNYSRVIRAVAQMRQEGTDIHYVIVGGRGWLEDEMYQTIADTHLTDYVHLLGFVDDDDLPALYSSARSLIIASLYEGFGLPILEAMACGIPVITSNLSSLPEVAGDATLLVDPLDIEAIYSAIRSIVSDDNLASYLRNKGYQQVKQFTWEKSATHLKSIYEQILST